MSGLSRRRFLGLAGGAGVLVAAGIAGPRLFGRAAATGELLTSQVPLPAPFQAPLPIPAVLAPVARDAEADRYEIVQREATVEILPGLRTPIWGYQGTFPGPTIESRGGRTAIVRHRNELPVPTVVHLHGGRTPPESDGYATDLVLPAGRTDPAHMSTHDLRPRRSSVACVSTCIRCGRRQPRCGTTITGWTSPVPPSTAAWPASTSSGTRKRTRCRCRAASGNCR